jgi:hypothetical protein
MGHHGEQLAPVRSSGGYTSICTLSQKFVSLDNYAIIHEVMIVKVFNCKKDSLYLCPISQKPIFVSILKLV